MPNVPLRSAARESVSPTDAVTARLAEAAAGLTLEDIPGAARRIARLALFDWYGVAWARERRGGARTRL